MSEARDRLLQELTKKLADEGRLIELGWVGLLRAAIPADAPDVQIREMRMAFMAGAQHLFASIMNMLDGEVEPSVDDMRRLDLIHRELETFRAEIERDARFARAAET
jgi:hypothetical protein